MSVSLTWLLIRPRRGELGRFILPAGAHVAILWIALLSLTVAQGYDSAPRSELTGYGILAVAVLALLAVPIISLSGSAARLSVRRREDQLATLRLLGAPRGAIRWLALAQESLQFFAGAAVGLIGYLCSAPLLSLLPVHGQRLGSVWLSWPPISVTVFVLLGVVVVSTSIGLRQIVVSPLGVRMRSRAPRLRWLRVGAAGVVMVGAVVAVQAASPGWGVVALTVALGLVVIAVMTGIGIAGPYVTMLRARRRHRKATSAVEIVASRAVLESPRAAWAQVSGVALASFLLVPAGSVLGFLDTVQRGGTTELTTEQLLFFADLRNAVIWIVVAAFLLVAVQVAVVQVAAVLERRDLYASLYRIGMPLKTMNRIQRKTAIMPLTVAAIGGPVVAAVLTFQLVLVSATNSPLFAVAIAATLVGGIGLVLAASAVTQPVLRGLILHPDRAL